MSILNPKKWFASISHNRWLNASADSVSDVAVGRKSTFSCYFDF